MDGLYLYGKKQAVFCTGVQLSPLPPPIPPLVGWEVVTDSNVDTVLTRILTVTTGKSEIWALGCLQFNITF